EKYIQRESKKDKDFPDKVDKDILIDEIKISIQQFYQGSVDPSEEYSSAVGSGSDQK
ncbi:hypothetical protein MHK_007371, partial [Candidatus Magnetomorum sp. HK-1]